VDDSKQRQAMLHEEALRDARRFGLIGGIASPKLAKERDAANEEHDRVVAELDGVRAKVIAEVAKTIGIDDAATIERTFAVPAGSVKAWLAPFVDRWRADDIVDKLRASDKRIAAIDRRIDAETASRWGSLGKFDNLKRFQDDAGKMA